MLSNFERSNALVLSSEGGFVNDPQDPGGATNLGVTIGTARALNLDINHDGKVDIVDIKLLKPADAAKVYKAFYWDKVSGDHLPAGLDYAVFDFAVNSGVSRAATFLQRIAGVKEDGVIGMATLAALAKLNTKSVINQLMNDRLVFLMRLPTWVRFGDGWGKRVTRVRAQALEWAA